MEKIISNINDLKKQIDINKESIIYYKTYFENGGLIKVINIKPFKIIYPNSQKINDEIKKIKTSLKTINNSLKIWNKTKINADVYFKKMKLIKFIKPLYWKHLLKTINDKKYKKDFEKSKISIDLIGNKKIEKIIKEFIDNPEYHENLLKTIDESIIYKNRDIGDNIVDSIKIKKSIAENKIELLEKNKEKLNNLLKAYNNLKKYL